MSLGPWVFGIDGGGSSSRLRIESLEGELLFKAAGGSTNLNSKPAEAVAAELSGLFAAAYAALPDLEGADCAAGQLGSAGAGRRPERESLTAMLRKASRVSAQCPLDAGNDAETALVGAMGETEGLLLIAGTGSIAYGRARDGSSVRAGGWGHLLGDEGSAYAIALAAVGRSIRSAEGRDLETALLPAALSFFGAAEIADLVPVFYRGFDKSRVAAFAPEVSRARDGGDILAIDIYENAAAQLALLAVSVHDRIAEKLLRRRLAFAGGLLDRDAWLAEAVKARIAAERPGVSIVPRASDAATGACILARARLSSP